MSSLLLPFNTNSTNITLAPFFPMQIWPIHMYYISFSKTILDILDSIVIHDKIECIIFKLTFDSSFTHVYYIFSINNIFF